LFIIITGIERFNLKFLRRLAGCCVTCNKPMRYWLQASSNQSTTGGFMTLQEFHDTVAFGIEEGRIIALDTKDGIKLFTAQHVKAGALDPARLEDAISAKEYRRLAALDMAAPRN
jgi:hypothetical protein